MQRQTVHVVFGVLHHRLGPVVVLAVRAAGDFVYPIILRVVIADIGGIAPVGVGVEFGAHIAAAAPILVANAEVFEPPRLFTAVFAAKLAHRGAAAEGHVFDPLAHLLHRAAAEVARYVSVTAYLTAQLKEFVGAEAVVLHNSAPVGVYHFFALGGVADAVAPVIFIRKAAARPAKHGKPHLPKGVHNVAAHTVDIRHGRILADKKPLVNASAEMLREVAVDILIDF